jgi:hypothetical protein
MFQSSSTSSNDCTFACSKTAIFLRL